MAVHQLHHQTGQAFGRALAVEQPRDVRVRQLRQDLPLQRQAVLGCGRDQGRVQQLQRSGLFVLAVGAFGAEHRAHAAVGDVRGDAPGSRLLADEAAPPGFGPTRRCRADGGLHRGFAGTTCVDGSQRAAQVAPCTRPGACAPAWPDGWTPVAQV